MLSISSEFSYRNIDNYQCRLQNWVLDEHSCLQPCPIISPLVKIVVYQKTCSSTQFKHMRVSFSENYLIVQDIKLKMLLRHFLPLNMILHLPNILSFFPEIYNNIRKVFFSKKCFFSLWCDHIADSNERVVADTLSSPI